jgi:hypothetical protein
MQKHIERQAQTKADIKHGRRVVTYKTAILEAAKQISGYEPIRRRLKTNISHEAIWKQNIFTN